MVNKFLESIKACPLEQIVKLENLLTVTNSTKEESLEADITGRKVYKYRVDVSLGRDITCSIEDLDYHKKQIQRSISEFVYGDIERRLHQWFYENNLPAPLNQQAAEEFFSILRDMRTTPR